MTLIGNIVAPVTGTVRFYPPRNITIFKVYANVSNPPSTTFGFIIKKNGVDVGYTFPFTVNNALMIPVDVSINVLTTDYLTMDITGFASTADLLIKMEYLPT